MTYDEGFTITENTIGYSERLLTVFLYKIPLGSW